MENGPLEQFPSTDAAFIMYTTKRWGALKPKGVMVKCPKARSGDANVYASINFVT